MRALPLLFAAAVVTSSVPALAQKAPHAAAEEEFKQARDAMSQGDYHRALELLRTSQATEPGRGKLLNIALCEEQLGLFKSALQHFGQVQKELATSDDRAAIVKQHIADVTPKVPVVKVVLPAGAAAGTTVKLDGDSLAPASLGTDIAVDPGKHVVTASVPGGSDRQYDATVAAGEHRTVEVAAAAAPPAAVPAVPPPAPAAPEAPATTHGPLWPVGLAAIGVGGASLVVGIATGAAAAAKRSSTAKLCPTPTTCPASVEGDINTYYALGNASTATLVIGGALAATGVVLVVMSRRGDKPAASAWVAPVVGLGALGARGAF